MNRFTNLPANTGSAVLDPTNGNGYITPAALDYKMGQDVSTGLTGGIRLLAGPSFGRTANTFAVADFDMTIVALVPDGDQDYWFAGISDAASAAHGGNRAQLVRGLSKRLIFALGSAGTTYAAVYLEAAYGDLPIGSLHTFRLKVQGSVATAYVDGVQKDTLTTAAAVMVDPVYITMGKDNTTPMPEYTQTSFCLANFVMTDVEALGASREESPGRLAYRGFEGWPTGAALVDGAGWANPATTKSWSGRTLSFTGGGYAGVAVYLGVVYKAGQTVTITGNVTANASTGALGCRVLLGSSTVVGSFATGIPVGATGPFTLTTTVSADGDGVGIREEYGNTVDITITDFKVTVEGTLEAFASGDVRTSTRWPGRYGSTLAPVGQNAIALNPKPKKTRHALYQLNYATGVATYISGETLPTITFADAFTALLWWPTWFTPALRASTSIKQTSGATGQGTFNMNAEVVTGGAYCLAQIESGSKITVVDFSFDD